MDKQPISKKAVSQVLHDYWHQYTIYPWRSIIAFIVPAMGTILVSFVPPLMIGRIIDTFASQHLVSISSVTLYIFLFGFLWAVGEVLWRTGLHFLISLETKGIKNLTMKAFDMLADRDYEFYSNNFVGSLSKRAFAYSRSFENFTDTISFNLIGNIFPVIFAVVILWRYSFWIPALLLLCLSIVIAVAIPLVKKRSKMVTERHIASSRMVGRLSDVLTNMLATKSFAKEKKEYAIYEKYVDDTANKFKAAADFHNLKFDTIISPFYVGTNVIGLIAAIYFAQKFGLQAGAIVIVFSYYSQVTRIFWEINRTYRQIESSISEAAEFTQMFVKPPKVKDFTGAKPLKVGESVINFDKVCFEYDEGKEKNGSFLNNFCLDIKGNQRVGLVGPSGSGKTTITKLLLRFIDLQSGRILIDSQDISKITQASLREAIAYVPQEPLLFHRSLAENIAYGSEKATEEEIINAAKLAHAHDFISSLPKGYQTLVGERGIKLSGGQRQRIAIARAILKKAPILVLDEATSALDSESEKYIQEGLWELMKGKTALVIAHRLSTVKHLDRIIVMDKGSIVQDGTHEELISQKGLYATLWEHQTDANKLEQKV